MKKLFKVTWLLLCFLTLIGLTTSCLGPSGSDLLLERNPIKISECNKINGVISELLVNEQQSKIYILDSLTNKISIYNDITLDKEKDIILPKSPSSIAFNYDKTGLFIAYSRDGIYYLDVDTGSSSLIVSTEAGSLGKMISITPAHLLYVLEGTIKIINISNGQVTDSKYFSTSGNIRDLRFNQANSSVYFSNFNNICRVRIDVFNGKMGAYTNNDRQIFYSYPICIINNGTRVITPYGDIYSCSANDSQDLRYFSSLKSYDDISCDDNKGYLYLIKMNQRNKIDDLYYDYLEIINEHTYAVVKRVYFETIFSSIIKYVRYTANGILVIRSDSSNSYVKTFTKAELGI